MLSLSAARRLSAGARASRSSVAAGAGRTSTNNNRIGASSSSSINTCRSRSSLSRAAAVGSTSSLKSQIPSLFYYSTERILSLRTGNKNVESLPKTMYDPTRETENCGVGLVASLKSVASRKVVEDADEMLIRMSHRGGVGCCPASGDGAGKLFYFCLLQLY